jgi:hypothetical protein
VGDGQGYLAQVLSVKVSTRLQMKLRHMISLMWDMEEGILHTFYHLKYQCYVMDLMHLLIMRLLQINELEVFNPTYLDPAWCRPPFSRKGCGASWSRIDQETESN